MSENTIIQKQKIREHFLQVRNSLPQKTVKEKSRKILDRILKATEFREAKSVHTYVSIKKNNEVDTIPLIKKCFEDSKNVVVPKILEGGRLKHLRITSLYELYENDWGVKEPRNNDMVSISELDLIVIPMIAGDHKKSRLGYGKGYYDRFLKNCTAIKMGLLFDCQLYEHDLPVEAFDIRLDYLITESKRID